MQASSVILRHGLACRTTILKLKVVTPRVAVFRAAMVGVPMTRVWVLTALYVPPAGWGHSSVTGEE
jgi:hypothetical protein